MLYDKQQVLNECELHLQYWQPIVGGFWKLSPWKLPNYGVALLTDTVVIKDFWITCVVIVVLLIVMIVFGIMMSKKQIGNIKI